MRVRPILAILLASTLALGLAACSDDDGADATTVGDATTPDGGGAVGATGPELGDHWHVAYAITLCGETLAPAQDRGADVLGIHTHGDGLVHTHPFSAQAVGARATLGVFLAQIGAEVTDDGLSVPAADAPEDCTGTVRVGQWDDAGTAAAGADPDRIVTEDVESIVMAPDLSALSIVVGPDDAEIPVPDAVHDICALAASDGPVDPATAQDRC